MMGAAARFSATGAGLRRFFLSTGLLPPAFETTAFIPHFFPSFSPRTHLLFSNPEQEKPDDHAPR
jgi:hypothetical protein